MDILTQFILWRKTGKIRETEGFLYFLYNRGGKVGNGNEKNDPAGGFSPVLGSPLAWGKYVFFAVGENMKEGEFVRFLSDSRVDMREHYFQGNGKSHKHKKIAKF